jgi:hypothetical protein
MTASVVDINSRRRGSYQTASVEQLQQDVKAELQAQNNTDGPDAGHSIIVQDLHALADDMMIRRLALIHKQEADRRSWATQEEEMAAELEAAAFLAFRSGVPEEAIYDIDFTPLSDALSSAIRKVASA